MTNHPTDQAHPPATGPLQPDATGIDRRRFLSHAAWAGTALVFSASGGVLSACSSSTATTTAPATDLTFVQISDTHIGFNGAANPDVQQTAIAAIAQINALATPPAFVVHTGDLTHTSTAAQFDSINQLLTTIKAPKVIAIPGEHDSTDDNGEKFRKLFGAGTKGDGWSSFDVNGVHFLALVNTLHLDTLGHLGPDQLAFIKADLAKLSSETPLVIFSHIPLFAMFPAWGWGTDDALTALSYTKRFASVTAINGHVHQLMTKTEGNVTFYAGRGTAYPLPAAGAAGAPAAKPLTVPPEQLRSMLGIRNVNYVASSKQLEITDQTLT